MKNHSKAQLFAGTLALGLLFSLAVPATVQAAEAEAYTYTITLAAGQKGNSTGAGVQVVDGGNYTVTPGNGKIVISGLPAGARVNLVAQDAVTLPNDSKYYVQGVRISGQDNTTARADAASFNAAQISPSFAVNADADYVVAYGILGDMAPYTVNYQDEGGNALAPSRTYYGNVGDSPVVAYLYVDGYQPQSYNLTKKLVANGADNVFTFVYHPITRPTAGSTTTTTGGTTSNEIVDEVIVTVTPAPGAGGTTGTTGNGGNVGNGAAGATGNDAAANNAGTSPADADANANANNAPADNVANGGEQVADAPQELIDIDENQTPLANFAGQIGNTVSNLSPVAIGGGIGVSALLVAGIVLLLKRRKKDHE